MSENLSSQRSKNSSAGQHFLNEEYTINTPENVTFGYDVAGIGSRFIGALVDSVLLGIVLFLLNFLLMAVISMLAPDGIDQLDLMESEDDSMWVVGLILALYSLINFILIWGYFIFFELIWRGQTPGKRVAGIRVVRMDGNAVGFLETVIRNLVRIIDFMPFAYGIGLIVMFFNRQSRRLGDFVAGTLVIHEQKAQNFGDLFVEEAAQGSASTNASLPGTSLQPGTSLSGSQPQALGNTPTASLSSAMSAPSAASDPLRERFANIQQLDSLDFELVADILHRHKSAPIAPGILRRTVTLMAGKLEMTLPTGNDHQFLSDLAEAYRRYHR